MELAFPAVEPVPSRRRAQRTSTKTIPRPLSWAYRPGMPEAHVPEAQHTSDALATSHPTHAPMTPEQARVFDHAESDYEACHMQRRGSAHRAENRSVAYGAPLVLTSVWVFHLLRRTRTRADWRNRRRRDRRDGRRNDPTDRWRADRGKVIELEHNGCIWPLTQAHWQAAWASNVEPKMVAALVVTMAARLGNAHNKYPLD